MSLIIDCHGHAGMHQINLAARPHMARGRELVDGVRGEDDHVKRLTRLHAPGGIHPAYGFDVHRVGRLLRIGGHQLCQHLAGGHGRNASEGGSHASPVDAVRPG